MCLGIESTASWEWCGVLTWHCQTTLCSRGRSSLAVHHAARGSARLDRTPHLVLRCYRAEGDVILAVLSDDWKAVAHIDDDRSGEFLNEDIGLQRGFSVYEERDPLAKIPHDVRATERWAEHDPCVTWKNGNARKQFLRTDGGLPPSSVTHHSSCLRHWLSMGR